MTEENALVVGLGEIGSPLAEILSAEYQVFTKDIDPLEIDVPIGVMHICYPFQIADFVSGVAAYIKQYQPGLTIIHSTVVPGTTSSVQAKTNLPVAFSAVRGKHTTMKEHMLSYTKFVGSNSSKTTQAAMAHLKKAGMTVDSFESAEALELSKLLETTYFGLLISWAQEQERFCEELGVSYQELGRFYEELSFFPPVQYQPGFIGGHCIIPNTHLLDKIRPSPVIDNIRASNDLKRDELLGQGKSLDLRLVPIARDSDQGTTS